MHKHRLYFIGGVVILLLSLLAVGCSNLPKEIQNGAKELQKREGDLRDHIDEKQKKFEEFRGSEGYGFHEPYSDRENWGGKFDEARGKADTAKGLYENELKPILDAGKAEDAQAAQVLIDRIDLALTEGYQLADYPAERAEFLNKVRDEGKDMNVTAGYDVALITKLRDDIVAPIDEAKAAFPGKDADLTTRMAEFDRRTTESATALATAQTQEKAANPDYAVWGDACTIISANAEWMKAEDTNVRTKLKELPRSYSVILVDQREDLFVVIQKAAWSELSEWDDTEEYLYEPRQVDRDTYAYFEGFPEDKEINFEEIDQDKWNSLGIDTEEGPNNSTEKFYVEDLPYTCFHKYMIEEDGVVREEDWKEVSEEAFEANEPNLGMVIMTKPVGMYEEDVLKVASPPGYAYAGDPKTGQWQSDGNGGSFWVFYGQYAFLNNMLGGNRIYQSDWDTWNRDYRGKQPYYGSDERYGTYSGNYAGSTYGRSGGIQAEDPSVRDAGPSSRGGGPGGGGK